MHLMNEQVHDPDPVVDMNSMCHSMLFFFFLLNRKVDALAVRVVRALGAAWN